MILRRAELKDLNVVEQIIADGRAFLARQGLPQWQNGTGPTVQDVERDIARGEGYVFTDENGGAAAYAALIAGVDEVYENIHSGAWAVFEGGKAGGEANGYVSIHRVAFAAEARGKGLAKNFIGCLISEAKKKHFKDIRIDTHEGNTPMRRVIAGAGFAYRGMVQFPFPFGERLAYQLQ